MSLYEQPLMWLTTNYKDFLLLDDWQLQLTCSKQEKRKVTTRLPPGYHQVTTDVPQKLTLMQVGYFGKYTCFLSCKNHNYWWSYSQKMLCMVQFLNFLVTLTCWTLVLVLWNPSNLNWQALRGHLHLCVQHVVPAKICFTVTLCYLSRSRSRQVWICIFLLVYLCFLLLI